MPERMATTRDLDPNELAERVNEASRSWAPDAVVATTRPLPGGASSLTYLAELNHAPESTVVVKVAVPGVEPVRNRDVLRQARLLRALESSDEVLVPRVLFEDGGDPPDVPPLFAMTFVEGEAFEPILDDLGDDSLPPPEHLERRAHDAARVLAALHAVSPFAVGLGDEPEISLADEVDRWVQTLSSVSDEFADAATAGADRLHASRPSSVPSTVIHGDFRLGNTLCQGPTLRAVIDWEIWARSDPRIDLAWFVMSCDAAAHPSAQRTAPGMPSTDALLATYKKAGGPSVDGLDWFHALMLFKLGATSALIAKHQLKRGDPTGIGARARDAVPDMLARADAALP